MSNKKIMIVDDEPDIVQALSMRLRAKGYDIVVAMDAYQATTTAMREIPDLVVLDIGMPAGDGHKVAERIRGSFKTCHIPIIIVSARTAKEDRDKAEANKVQVYLTKPFDAKELLAHIEQLLDEADGSAPIGISHAMRG